LFHDFEEVVTGDIVTPPKYRSEALRQELEKVGQEMLEETLHIDFE
jgi:5'-deoxynucleotidase YfbR-like HD superfamily hydrolase